MILNTGPEIGQYSPDGRWWWNGVRWIAVPVAPGTSSQTPSPQGQYSPDGRWWWNGVQWIAVPVAPGPVPIPSAAAKKGMGTGRKVLSALLVLALAGVAIIVGGSTLFKPSSSTSHSDTFSANFALALALEGAYAAMVRADNADLAQIKSSDAATSAAGWRQRVADHKTFDEHVVVINWPYRSIDASNQVLDDDIALEKSYADADAARTSASCCASYNAILSAQAPLETAFYAAVKSLDDSIAPGGGSSSSSPSTGGSTTQSWDGTYSVSVYGGDCGSGALTSTFTVVNNSVQDYTPGGVAIKNGHATDSYSGSVVITHNFDFTMSGTKATYEGTSVETAGGTIHATCKFNGARTSR